MDLNRIQHTHSVLLNRAQCYTLCIPMYIVLECVKQLESTLSFHRRSKPDQIRPNQLQSSIPLLQSNYRGMLDCSWLGLTF